MKLGKGTALLAFLMVIQPASSSVAAAPLGVLWVEAAMLSASDETHSNYFGFSVSLSGTAALVGAYGRPTAGHNSGAAYVYVKEDMSWIEQAILTADDAEPLDHFGFSVAVSADTAVVGAIQDDDNGTDSGAAYVFVENGGAWSQQAKLVAADGVEGDWFGRSVAVQGDVALVGSRRGDAGSMAGSAYVFVRNGGTWAQQARLVASDGEDFAQLGVALALDGNTAVVGAFQDLDGGVVSGSAYVFVENAGVWTEEAKLLPSDGEDQDYFGGSVAVSGDTALIGSLLDDDNGSGSGSAYVFTRTGTDWTEAAKLLASDGTTGMLFGTAVSIDGPTAAVGAEQDDGPGQFAGAVYVFAEEGGGWAEQAKLKASDAEPGDRLGESVSVSGNRVLAGAGAEFGSTGKAYVFDTGSIFADGLESGDTSAWSATVP